MENAMTDTFDNKMRSANVPGAVSRRWGREGGCFQSVIDEVKQASFSSAETIKLARERLKDPTTQRSNALTIDLAFSRMKTYGRNSTCV